jgi:hypothetical protein
MTIFGNFFRLKGVFLGSFLGSPMHLLVPPLKFLQTSVSNFTEKYFLECKDMSCIQLNTYDPIKETYMSYPTNYSDPCTQRILEKFFYVLQNLPEDLIDGRLQTCSNDNYNYPNMDVVAHKENLTRKIDEYFGPNPFELLLPFYKVSTGFCNNQIYVSYQHEGKIHNLGYIL